MEFNKNLDLNKIVDSNNVAEMMDPDDLEKLGEFCVVGYEMDKQTRSEWEDRMAGAIKLAMQLQEEKTFPWQGAANVKFPLITIAALQFHARAYPATIPGPDVVGCRVFGEDPDGSKQARADRVSAHMSYQRMEEDENWEESHDKLLITLGIVGSAFKKTYYDSIRELQISELVRPDHLVVDYYTKDIKSAARITQILQVSRNYCFERERAGLWLECDDETNAQPLKTGVLDDLKDRTQGTTPPGNDSDTPITILEQHCLLDLDGDGYKEPYVVFVRHDTRKVCRVVARFYKDGIKYNKLHKLQRIDAEHFYTKFSFIPSPDGGFYDMGFGTLLGPLNEAIDSLINQLLDSGTLSNTAGGFLGRGINIKGGDFSFRPNEWKRTESTGGDLRQSIFPLPVREPSNVLYQLLGLLIDFGTKIGMATDALVGDNVGQNTPAETSRNMITQGEKVFNAIYKRIYRSLKQEFRKCYRLNQVNYPDNGRFDYISSDGKGAFATVEDYTESDKSIIPTADPYVVSDDAKALQALTMKQASATTPGYNKDAVERNFLKSIKVQSIERFLPDPNGPNAVKPGTDPKVQIEQMKLQSKAEDRQAKERMAMAQLQADMAENQAKVEKLKADAIKLESEAKWVLEETVGINKAHELAVMEAQINAMQVHQDNMIKLATLMKDAQNDSAERRMGTADT